MRLTRSSTLQDVAAAVSGALSAAGIEAVLTGGACATLYTEGEYQSSDLDFILQSSATRRALDSAMRSVGFRPKDGRYEHPETEFFVEFPPGPLGIGADIAIRSVERRIGRVSVRLLSPTDSCRDRLAAYYHWNDRQSLDTAARIAARHRVNLRRIREWSSREGASDRYDEFLRILKERRVAGGRTGGSGGSRRTGRRR